MSMQEACWETTKSAQHTHSAKVRGKLHTQSTQNTELQWSQPASRAGPPEETASQLARSLPSPKPLQAVLRPVRLRLQQIERKWPRKCATRLRHLRLRPQRPGVAPLRPTTQARRHPPVDRPRLFGERLLRRRPRLRAAQVLDRPVGSVLLQGQDRRRCSLRRHVHMSFQVATRSPPLSHARKVQQHLRLKMWHLQSRCPRGCPSGDRRRRHLLQSALCVMRTKFPCRPRCQRGIHSASFGTRRRDLPLQPRRGTLRQVPRVQLRQRTLQRYCQDLPSPRLRWNLKPG